MLIGLLALLGRPVTWREGFLLGPGGFAAFVIAPSLGLPPELPGIPAPLTPRQLRSLATALATPIGLWLVVFRRSPPPGDARDPAARRAAPDRRAPARRGPDLRPGGALARVGVAVTLTTLLSWSLLAGLAGYLHQRFAQAV